MTDAIGRGTPYHDGAWLHPSWRARGLALYRRFAARLNSGVKKKFSA